MKTEKRSPGAENIDRAVANGWLEMHESGTYYRFTQAGKNLFA